MEIPVEKRAKAANGWNRRKHLLQGELFGKKHKEIENDQDIFYHLKIGSHGVILPWLPVF